MKFSILKVSITLFLILIITNLSLSKHKGKAKTHFNEGEAKKIATFAKLANCGSRPLQKNCKECISPKGGFKMFFFYQFTRLEKYDYKFFIHYNDQSKEIVVSFGAPSVENHEYVKTIYSHGWSLIKTYKISVESEFRIIYYQHLKRILSEKIHKLKESGRLSYKFIFTGYSLGASIATLAAFDLTKEKILHNHINHTEVYTYGGLRIGDAQFVSLVNETVTLWRVVKQNDFIVRIPNCYYSQQAHSWRCFTEPVIKKFIIDRRFPLKVYYTRYLGGSRGPLGKLIMFRHENVNQHHQNIESPAHPVEKHVIIKNQRSFNPHSPNFIESSSKKSKKSNKTNKHKKRQYPHNNHWVTPEMIPSGSLNHVKEEMVKTYYKYIYYTQPIGRQIFYNSQMTTYQSCPYIHGVSNCEKESSLPTSFTTEAHKSYYGLDFDKCQ